MKRAIGALISETGEVRLLEPVKLKGVHKALVMIADDATSEPMEGVLLSEQSLSDWNRPEEDAAWAHLQ